MRSTEVQALVEASGIKEAKIWRVEKSGKDPMDVVVFKTGGGVITYRKSANDKVSMTYFINAMVLIDKDNRKYWSSCTP